MHTLRRYKASEMDPQTKQFVIILALIQTGNLQPRSVERKRLQQNHGHRWIWHRIAGHDGASNSWTVHLAKAKVDEQRIFSRSCWTHVLLWLSILLCTNYLGSLSLRHVLLKKLFKRFGILLKEFSRSHKLISKDSVCIHTYKNRDQ